MLLVGCGASDLATSTAKRVETARWLRLGLTTFVPKQVRVACAHDANGTRTYNNGAKVVAIDLDVANLYCPSVVPKFGVTAPDISATEDPFGVAIGLPNSSNTYIVDLTSSGPEALMGSGVKHWLFESASMKVLQYELKRGAGVARHRGLPPPRQVTISNQQATIVHVAPYPWGGEHGGHVAVLWAFGGNAYDVSFHGYQYLAQARAVASSIIDKQRSCPPGNHTSTGVCDLVFHGPPH